MQGFHLPLSGEGGIFLRGANAPLFITFPLMLRIYIHITESQREAEPPLYNQFPLMLGITYPYYGEGD